MAIFRVEKNKKYTVVDNYFIDDPNISLKAKGLLLMFLKRPDNWDIYLSELEKCCKDKKDSMNTAIKELEKFGYIERNLKRDEKGKLIGGYDYIIKEKPEAYCGFSLIGENPNRENPPLINTDINKNTDINISKDILSATSINKIINEWNSLGLQKIISVNAGTKRYKSLKARIKDYDLEKVLQAIKNINESKFLKGENNRNWTISFDWLLNPNNFIKVLEGNYKDKENGGKSNGSFRQDFGQSKEPEYDYDYDEIINGL
ncbi:TPA: helix-turn-helix domain-containing protein [Clostridium perfringens]